MWRYYDGSYGYWQTNNTQMASTKPKPKRKPKPKNVNTMAETTQAITNFKKTLKEHCTKDVGQVSTVLEAIKKINETTPPSSNVKMLASFARQRSKALEEGIQMYVRCLLSGHYPLISKDLFKLRRYLTMDGRTIVGDRTTKSGRHSVRVSLFVDAVLGTDRVEMANFRENFNRYRISVKVPELPQNLIASASKAMATAYKVLADAYANTNIYGLKDETFAPELRITWIPTVESLNLRVEEIPQPKPKAPPIFLDPALILAVWDSYYLVDTWDIQKEKPFRHFLREFSFGSILDKLDK